MTATAHRARPGAARCASSSTTTRALGAAAADLHRPARPGRRRRPAGSAPTRRCRGPTPAPAGRSPVPQLLVDLVDAALRRRRQHRRRGRPDPRPGDAAPSATTATSRAVRLDGPAAGPPDRPPRRPGATCGCDRAAGLLTVPAGTALDLGATAKAYTADLAARTLPRRYGTPVLVELGGDLAVAGDRAGGWCIRVAEREGGAGQLVAASGAAAWRPRPRPSGAGGAADGRCTTSSTRAPAHRPTGRGARSPSLRPTALHANTASTAAIVLGDARRRLADRRAARRPAGRPHDGAVTTTGRLAAPTSPTRTGAAHDDLVSSPAAPAWPRSAAQRLRPASAR